MFGIEFFEFSLYLGGVGGYVKELQHLDPWQWTKNRGQLLFRCDRSTDLSYQIWNILSSVRVNVADD